MPSPSAATMAADKPGAKNIDGLATVLFLDVDGVMHPFLNPRLPQAAHDAALFSPACMQHLADVVRDTGAAVVLSSSWRLKADLRNRLLPMLIKWGVPVWVSTTRSLPGQQRPREILEWVEKHRPLSWVAVDDWPLHESKGMRGHFVQTRNTHGLQQDTANRIRLCFEQQQAHRRDMEGFHAANKRGAPALAPAFALEHASEATPMATPST